MAESAASLQGQCYAIFHLQFFRQTTPSGPFAPTKDKNYEITHRIFEKFEVFLGMSIETRRKCLMKKNLCKKILVHCSFHTFLLYVRTVGNKIRI
jgi:hypothetical protein